MVIFEEEGCNIFLHGELTGSLGVVPGKVDAGVKIAAPVFGDVVVFLDDVAQVMGMLEANVFDTEVVDDESEHDGSPFVAPKARCGIKLVIAGCVESSF